MKFKRHAHRRHVIDPQVTMIHSPAHTNITILTNPWDVLVQKTFNSRIRFSIMTYFNKYRVIYRYSRNGTFLFSSNCSHFCTSQKYLPFNSIHAKFHVLVLEHKNKNLLFFSLLGSALGLWQEANEEMHFVPIHNRSKETQKLRPYQLVQK